MGILNFWKKKAPDIPMIDSPGATSIDANMPSDLPPIGGESADGSGTQQSQQPLTYDQSQGGPKSLSVNMPTLDFSMPVSDDEALPQQLPQLDALPDNNDAASESEIVEPPAPVVQEEEKTSITPEDLNGLFINDEGWKEPDLDNYNPYTEDTIEEPQPEDFAAQGLPTFEEAGSASGSMSDSTSSSMASPMAGPMVADMPISEPNEPFPERPKNAQSPVELFIRGKVYSRVFVELDQVSKTLSALDSQVGNYEETLKKEEPLISTAKEQVEYLYRKLNNIDKKIFVQ